MIGLSKPGWRAWKDIDRALYACQTQGVNKGHAASEALLLHNGREARTKAQRIFAFFDYNSGGRLATCFSHQAVECRAQRYAIVFSNDAITYRRFLMDFSCQYSFVLSTND